MTVSPTSAEDITPTIATIANGASLSGAVNLGGEALIRLQMPAAWTAAKITFQVSDDDVTYRNIVKEDGSEYELTVAASTEIILIWTNFIGVKYMKIRSGTAAAAVNQGASRDIGLVTRRIQ